MTVEESVSALCDKVRSYKMHSDLTEAVVAVAEATKLSPLDGLEVIKQQTAALISSHQENDSETMAGLAPQLRAEYLAMKAGEVKLKGKPFPWDALNKATLGFQKQHVVVYYARPKHFKAQPLNAQVLTPAGFRFMGDLSVGDFVIGSDGRPTKVVGVYPQGQKEVYRVTMSDGTSTRCCDEHLWFTQTRSERRRGSPGRARTLREIRLSLRAPDGRANHRAPVVGPVEFDATARPLPLHPYLLGALLGDGSMTRHDVTFCKPEDDIVSKVIERLPPGDSWSLRSSEGHVPSIGIHANGAGSRTAKALESLGLLGKRSHEKFIPFPYNRASVPDRLELLRGLLDTDGHVSDNSIHYSTTSPDLADGVADLARSLGALVSRHTPHRGAYTYKDETLEGRMVYGMTIRSTNDLLLVSSRKHLSKMGEPRARLRTITSVEPCDREPCQCIEVDAPDHLYVTDDYIVTHNTWHALNTLRGLQAHGEPGVIFSQEMSAIEIARRWVALDAGVDYTSFLLGTLDEEAEARFFARLDEFVEKPNITIDTITSTGSAAVTEMSAKIGDYGARAVLLDGLYFLGEDWRELSEVTRGAKRISKAQDLYFLATTQQNRMKNQSGGDDVAYGDSALQDCDLLLKFSRDAMLRRQHKVAARVAAVRSGTEVAFEIHCVPCTNFSQGHVILDEDSDADPLDEKADGEDGTEGIPDAPGQE